jgi:hypothetical protein
LSIRQERQVTMASSSERTAPSVATLVMRAEFHAEIHSLLVRDAAWTRLPDQQADFDPADREALARLAETMTAQLERIEQLLPMLRSQFTNYADWFEGQTRGLHALDELSGDLQSRFQQVVRGDRSMASDLDAAIADLGTRLPLERRELQSKARVKRGSEPAATDMSDSTWCALAVVDAALLAGLAPTTGGATAVLASVLLHEAGAEYGCFGDEWLHEETLCTGGQPFFAQWREGGVRRPLKEGDHDAKMVGVERRSGGRVGDGWSGWRRQLWSGAGVDADRCAG